MSLPARLQRIGTELGRLRRPDGINRVRRFLAMQADQMWTSSRWALERSRLRLGRRGQVPPFDGDPRFALLTVNCSTTHELKLSLLTLCDQAGLEAVGRIVIADNGSRDGGVRFLRKLDARVDRVHVVRNRVFRNHARGMRRCLRVLDEIEHDDPESARANLLLFSDPDVIFRRPDTLTDLSSMILGTDASLVGEFRRGAKTHPDIQASFFVVRRDCYASPSIAPWVHHGSPAYWMQRSILNGGHRSAHFPSNHGGYVLHKGRAAVAAARRFTPWRAYATAAIHQAHFMGVPDGRRIWTEAEARHGKLLEADGEEALLDVLEHHLLRLGGSGPRAHSRERDGTQTVFGRSPGH